MSDIDMRSYEIGYRDGESSREADYNFALTEAFDGIEDTSPNGVVAYFLASDWLAAHDARVRAEALAPIEALAEEWAGCQAGCGRDAPTTDEWGGVDEGGDYHNHYALASDHAAALRAAMEAKG